MAAAVVRVFTPARRFNRIIGRFSDGTKIPFGPYTLTQATAAVIGFVVAAVVLRVSPWLVIPTIIITATTVFALGFIPETQVPIRRRILLELSYLARRSPRTSKH